MGLELATGGVCISRGQVIQTKKTEFSADVLLFPIFLGYIGRMLPRYFCNAPNFLECGKLYSIS